VNDEKEPTSAMCQLYDTLGAGVWLIKEVMEEGVEMGEITKRVRLLEYRTMALYDLHHGKNVIKAYEEIEWESE
jgi:hypothetical protein